MSIEKLVLTAEGLLNDSFKLGSNILQSGFYPTMIIAIWRGGTPVGMAVQELLAYFGVRSDHIAIRTSSYTGVDQRGPTVRVHGLNYLIKKICRDDRLLIVDDVFDTGHTITAVVEELQKKARRNMPAEVKVAVPWYKPTRRETSLTPDYYVHSTDKWLVFPHELDALTPEEMKEARPVLYDILAPGRREE